MIKLITFDLDDTLWDNRPVIRKAVQEGYNWLLTQCPELAQVHSIESLNQLKDEIKNSTPDLAHRVSKVRIIGMQQALIQVGYESEEALQLAREAFKIFQHWRHKVELFSGAVPMLEELSREYPLAVITNGNADVNALGLGQYFEFSISAEDLNRSKPDPVVFQEALDIAGIAAKYALHIGDNLITDVKGAAGAGMQTVWFNPERSPLDSHSHRPDFTVHSLSDIPGVLKR